MSPAGGGRGLQTYKPKNVVVKIKDGKIIKKYIADK